jgi:ABC-type polysaccharide/polyol phosphate export permease
MWLTIVISAYCLLFSIGFLLRLEILSGIIILLVGLILWFFIIAYISKTKPTAEAVASS